MTRKPPTLAPARPTDLVAPSGSPLTVYLLHAPVGIGRTKHYLGITRTERLAARLREHAMRRGSSLTAALAARNDHLLLARTWAVGSYADERRLKNRGHYQKLCPVCRQGTADAALLSIPCPDLTALDECPENIGLGMPLRGVQSRLR